MAKRRNVIMGLGAMAVGSGAVFGASASFNQATSPGADLRVIADAQLRVRSVRNDADVPQVVSEIGSLSGDFGDNYVLRDTENIERGDTEVFEDDAAPQGIDDLVSELQDSIDSPGSPTAAGLEITDGVNNDLGINAALTTGEQHGFDPLIEITNDSPDDYEVGISFAENDDESGGNVDDPNGDTDGYGDNVGVAESFEYNDSDPETVSRKAVQEIYQFKLSDVQIDDRNEVQKNNIDGGSGNSSTVSGDHLISPNPNTADPADEATDDETFILGAGDTVFAYLDVTTDPGQTDEPIVGQINSAAAGGAGNPFQSNTDVDLLNNIFLTADEVED